jgi:enoyl-CoA hydratase/carnithine racemase
METISSGILLKISKLSVIFIAEVAGIARGIGSEFIAKCDLRFAARGKARIGQLEILLGALPGGGGVPYLIQHMGRAKAVEYMLSGEDIDADTAEKIGLVNHTYDADVLRCKVDEYANRMALFESDALALVKEQVNVYSRPREEEIWKEDWLFWEQLAKPRQAHLLEHFIRLTDNFSDGVYERDVAKTVSELYK